MRTFTATALLSIVAVSALHAQKAKLPAADSAEIFLTGEVSYADFHGSIEPWKLASLSIERRTAGGSLIGTLNYANRFSISGAQIEADAYPRLNTTTYAYVNAGFSSSEIFPASRFGGEIFKNLPHAWEASAGFRQLNFRDDRVTLVTGTLGKYFSDYWVSARPFVRVKSSGSSASLGITARRYFADADHFAGCRASYGSAPSDQITPDQLVRTRSYSADIHGSGGPWARAVATWSLGFAHDQLAASRARESWTATVGMKVGL